jgi:hypothetical protein
MPGLFLDPVDGGKMFFCNVWPSLNYTTIHRTIFSTVTAIRTLNAMSLIRVIETEVTDRERSYNYGKVQ